MIVIHHRSTPRIVWLYTTMALALEHIWRKGIAGWTLKIMALGLVFGTLAGCAR